MEAAKIKEILRQQNRTVSEWLVNYNKRKHEHEEGRLELLKKSELNGHSKMKSKPTETLAVKLASYDDNNTARWLSTIEIVVKTLNHKQAVLLKLRQECKLYAPKHGGRPGWIAPIQFRMGEIIGACPAEQILKQMWSDIVVFTARLAYIKNCKF